MTPSELVAKAFPSVPPHLESVVEEARRGESPILIEEWRWIPGIPNYKVSNLGRVWSKPRPHTSGGILSPRVADNSRGSSPYAFVSLRGEGEKWRHWRVHLAV